MIYTVPAETKKHVAESLALLESFLFSDFVEHQSNHNNHVYLQRLASCL